MVDSNGMDTAMATGSTTASNADVRAAFNIDQEICIRQLITDDDIGTSTIPTNVIAAVLVSVVKGIASPGAYVTPLPSTSYQHYTSYAGGLRQLAINFLRFHSQFVSGSSAQEAHMTLVKVVQHCKEVVLKWSKEKESPTLVKLFQYFLKHVPNIGGALQTTIPGEMAIPSHLLKPSASDMDTFVKLLLHTFESICLCTQQNLEDIMDFDYLWANLLNDPGRDDPYFNADRVAKSSTIPNDKISNDSSTATAAMKSETEFQCPKCNRTFHFKSKQTAAASIGNHLRACDPEKQANKAKKQKREIDEDMSAESIRQVAKELAWSFSRVSSARHSNNNSHDRRDRIIDSAGCIDLVVASMLAPIISASAEKRRMFEEGNISPQLSVEDEAAAALSNMLNGPIDIDLREKAKASLLHATDNLLSTVLTEPSQIHQKDIMANAQRISSLVLPLLTESSSILSERSSPASRLLASISSHSFRERNLHILKAWMPSTLESSMKVTLSSIPPDLTKEEIGLKLGWHVGNLQRTYFIDSLNEFCRLNFAERKLLAPFVPKSSTNQTDAHLDEAEQDLFIVRSIVYGTDQQKSQKPHTTVKTVRHALQISRVKNPPASDKESKDLNEWVTELSFIVSNKTIVKPSDWLLDHMQSSSASVPDKSDNENQHWKTTILPVLNHSLKIVAAECSLDPKTCVILDNGQYKVHQDDVTPGVVLQLYYWALEAFLRSTMNILDKELHSSLFSLCHFCLMKAKHPDDSSYLIEDMGNCPVKFHMIIGTLTRDLKPDSETVTMNLTMALPSYVTRILCQVQDMLHGLVWMRNASGDGFNHTFVDMVNEVRKNSTTWRRVCPLLTSEESTSGERNEEEMLVGYMLQNLTNVIQQRVSNLCELLSLPFSFTTTMKTMEVFTTMLHHRTKIFFDRHPDQLMLCSLYTAIHVSNAFVMETAFQNIADAYMEMNRDQIGSEVSYAILHRIKDCSDHDHEFGDIISFFNNVFVPNMQPFWRSFKKRKSKWLSLQAQALDYCDTEMAQNEEISSEVQVDMNRDRAESNLSETVSDAAMDDMADNSNGDEAEEDADDDDVEREAPLEMQEMKDQTNVTDGGEESVLHDTQTSDDPIINDSSQGEDVLMEDNAINDGKDARKEMANGENRDTIHEEDDIQGIDESKVQMQQNDDDESVHI